VRALRRRPWHVALAALAAGLALSPAPALAVAGTAALCGGLGLLGLRSPPLALLAAALVVSGAAMGSLRIAHIEARAAAPVPGTAARGRAVLLERPRPSRFGWSCAARLASGGIPVLLRAGWSVRPPSDAGAGSIVEVSGLVGEPRRSPGSSLDWPAYLHRRGIWRELSLETLRPVGRRGGVAGIVDSIRRRGEAALGTPLLRGMVLGEDESIDDRVRDDFRRSGLAHVLAVSGQNVMLLFALAAPLLGAARAGPRVRIVVLLALVALYVPLAGAGPSLQRAGVMAVAGLAATAAGRPASRWYALLLAAAVTLALNPLAAGDPGWQLSFAAVAGILLLAAPIRAALRGLPRPVAEGAAITLAATVATAPLLAHHFGSFSLAGIGANLAALPVVAPIMWLGTVQVAAAQAGAAAAPLVAAAGHANGLLAGVLTGLARRFAEMPGAHVVLPLGSAGAVVAAYALLAVTAVAVRAGARRLEPWRATGAAGWRRARLRTRVAAVVAAAALAGIGALRATATPAAPHELTVRFLDVGQGDATLIQDGHGASVLFDGGPPEARVYRQLRAAGVGSLDLMVSTHQSRDHQGGLHEVLERIPTRAMLENGYGTRDPDYRRLLAEADARGVRHVAAQAGQVLHVGQLVIRVLGPPPRAPGEPPPDDPNGTGIAAIVSEGTFDLWLSADAESDAILQYPLRPVEAMKVSHHGSRDDGLPEVLRRLRPQVAAIEVGKGNPYGHPAPETLAALRAAVPHVYRTDLDGTVTLSVAAGRMTVRTER
jgi:competence protein ComEC